MQPPGAGGLALNQISALSDVVAKIVKLEMAIFEELDQLPVAEAHGGCWPAALIAVMRVVPEERAPGDFPAFEEWTERYAVDVAGVHVHGFAEGGKEIDAGDWRIDDAARFGHAGPADEERLADATLEQMPFAGAERGVVGDRLRARGLITNAAIIGEENHDGAVGLARVFERFEQLAGGCIGGFDHGAVSRVAIADVAFAVFFDQVFRGLERDVHGELGLIKEERLCAGFANEAAAFVREPLGEEFAGL